MLKVKTDITVADLPIFMANDLADQWELEYNDPALAKRIAEATPFELLDDWLKENNIHGYTQNIVDVFCAAYGLDRHKLKALHRT